MLYMTGEADTLRELYKKVGYSGTFQEYERDFAFANGKFLNATPFYRNLLPQFMPFYVTPEAFYSYDLEMDDVVCDVRKYSYEERVVLRELQEDHFPDEFLEMFVTLAVIRDEYEKFNTSQHKPEPQKKNDNPKSNLGGSLDIINLTKDISIAGVKQGAVQLDVVDRFIEYLRPSDNLYKNFVEINKGVVGNKIPAEIMNAKLTETTEILKQQEGMAGSLKKLQGDYSSLKKEEELLRKRGALTKQREEFFKKQKELLAKKIQKIKSSILLSKKSIKKAQKITTKKLLNANNATRFNFKTISMDRFSKLGRSVALRSFLRSAADAGRALRGVGHSFNIAGRGASILTRMTPIINLGRKALPMSKVLPIISVLTGNPIMIPLSGVLDGIDEALNTGDPARVYAAVQASLISGLVQAGVTVAVTAAVTNLTTTGSLVGLSMLAGGGAFGTIVTSALIINPVLGGILIVGTIVIMYFVGDEIKNALKPKLYDALKQSNLKWGQIRVNF